FGISMIASETQSPGSSTRRQGTIRWMSPEMLRDSLFEPQHLLARDVYAFGCTILEIYSGQPPFSHLKSDGCVIAKVLIDKEKPPRPPLNDFPSNALWSLVAECMSWHAKDRPSATGILRLLLHMQDHSSPSLLAHPDSVVRVCTPTSLESSSGELQDVGSDSDSDRVYSPPPSSERSDPGVTFMIDSSSESESEQLLSAPSKYSPPKRRQKRLLLIRTLESSSFQGVDSSRRV
ncbi:kinase-like protein, partial [Hymenopellis radicata]